MDLSVQFPVPWEGAENFTFTAEQLDGIEILLKKMMADAVADFEAGKMDERGLMAKLFYLDGLTDYQRNPRRVFDRCVAGRRFVNISPEGKVYFCPCLKHILIGDLREKPFDDIWLGREATMLRKKIDRRFCHCWLNCTIYPNASEALEEKRPYKVQKGNFINRLWRSGATLRG
jgi:radical SAM protein with 4Fe4S-binding SPASM domain